MVRSKNIFRPQDFVEELTGNYYIFKEDDTTSEIHKLLKQNGVETEDNPLWDYPLDEIEHIVENKIDVVLVETSYYECGVYIQELRWFEVPETFGLMQHAE